MDEILKQAAEYIQTTQGAIATAVIIVAGLWQYHRFVMEWNFKNYHQLIKDLNQSDTNGEPIKLYRQVAVVYELRNYPRYYPVSRRILRSWLDSRKIEAKDSFLPLYKEMELGIEFMNKNFLIRYLENLMLSKKQTYRVSAMFLWALVLDVFYNLLGISYWNAVAAGTGGKFMAAGSIIFGSIYAEILFFLLGIAVGSRFGERGWQYIYVDDRRHKKYKLSW